MTTTRVKVKTRTSTEADASFGSGPPAGPLRLLHVEDNAADAMLMQEYIKGILADVEFDNAERLADLSAERADRADCAILDLSLPDASGLDALIALRGMSITLPIIVLTGFDDLEVGLSALRYGADDYLVKNQVDGFTLERAVRYAVERRHLALDVAREAAAATFANAGVKRAQAALGAEMLHTMESGDIGVRSTSQAAIGTHQVAVRIDAGTGDYALVCESCDWQAERGDDVLHSWRDRSLDWVLMRHVAFGRVVDVASAMPTPAARAAATGPPARRHQDSDPDAEGPVPRRSMLSPGRWLQHHPDGEAAAKAARLEG